MPARELNLPEGESGREGAAGGSGGQDEHQGTEQEVSAGPAGASWWCRAGVLVGMV
jgi:hypothetical protein